MLEKTQRPWTIKWLNTLWYIHTIGGYAEQWKWKNYRFFFTTYGLNSTRNVVWKKPHIFWIHSEEYTQHKNIYSQKVPPNKQQTALFWGSLHEWQSYKQHEVTITGATKVITMDEGIRSQGGTYRVVIFYFLPTVVTKITIFSFLLNFMY